MALQVYSTLTRRKEPFHRRPGDAVSMYVCGPTVYKPSHIGHMVGPVIFDTVKRYLTYLGYKVTWVVNITDVDDKLIKRAGELGTTVPALAAEMTADYFECLKKLNVTGIDHFPKATEHIAGMVSMIGTLIEKGHAYAAGGDVYFDVGKDADYGKLCNRDPEQLEAGSRVEVSDRKRNPGDFALWKGAKPSEPVEVQFDSPWGKGRPGWHIECSAMATKLLGETLDIHGGGLDLQFPHHENELAQSESATGKDFARVWMHNGLLKPQGGGPKMGGSLNNAVNMTEVFERHAPETVRFLLLSTHYRSPIEYSDDRLNEIAKSLQRFYHLFDAYERITGESFYALRPVKDSMIEYMKQVGGMGSVFKHYSRYAEQFTASMDEDFNTAGAVAVLFDLVSDLNRKIVEGGLEDKGRPPHAHEPLTLGLWLLRELSSILGLFWEPPAKSALGGGDQLVSGLMQLLLDLRNNLRTEAKAAAKDNPLKKALFDQTDLIRTRLGELGVTLEDRPGGTTWRVG
jgi:cysteinyl-tRNA synthetase